MSDKNPKVCVTCAYFSFQAAEEYYDEHSPGSNAAIECLHGYWQVSLINDSAASYRDKMLTARTCSDYEFVPLTKPGEVSLLPFSVGEGEPVLPGIEKFVQSSKMVS